MDRGAYMPGPRSWRDTPPCAEHFAADSFLGGEGGYQSEGELTSGWLTSYQRNQQRAHPLPPAIELSWQSCSDPKLEHPYIYLKLSQQLISYNPIKHRKFKVWKVNKCNLHACMLSRFSHVWLFMTLWTIAHRLLLSMGFSRREHWSGLPCPLLQGIFLTQGSNPHLLRLLYCRQILYHWATRETQI